MQNIAVGTLLLFLLVIPGMTFRHAFTFGPLSRKRAKLSVFDDFIIGIIPGIAIQFFGAAILNSYKSTDYFDGYYVDFQGIGRLLAGTDIATEFEKIGQHTWQIILYNTALIFSAGALGYFLRWVIRTLDLDYKIKALRFSNEWHYLLKGEFKFFKENMKGEKYPKRIRKRKLIATCYVNALVRDIDGKCHIYQGVVDSIYLASNGELEKVYITGAKRMPFGDISDIHKIGGDIHVLKHDEIIDLNVEVIFRKEFKKEKLGSSPKTVFKSLKKLFPNYYQSKKEDLSVDELFSIIA